MMIAKNELTGDLGVAFPGSDGYQDWTLNLTSVAADWVLDGTCDEPNTSKTLSDAVHAGFLIDYASIRDKLRNQLFAAMPALEERARAQVFFSGHSLGGALATLASKRVRTRQASTSVEYAHHIPSRQVERS
jgi:hypothetical protein